MKRGLAYVLSIATLYAVASLLLVGCDGAGKGGALPSNNGPVGGSYTGGGPGGPGGGPGGGSPGASNSPGGGPGGGPGFRPGGANGPR